jgi:DNA-binding GntR family transcriptional regulator
VTDVISDGSELTSSFGELVARIYDRIYDQLISVAIEPGQRISVDALAREFQASQTPIRAALARLESENLVVKSHLRGYRASALLSRKEVDDLFDLRIMLETYAATRAAQLRSPQHVVDLRRLDAVMSKSETNQIDGAGYAEFTALDRRLHDVVALAAGNSLVRDALTRLHSHVHIYRIRRTVIHLASREHHLIIDGIELGDQVLAEAAMRSHLEHARRRVLDAFD